MSEKKKKPRDAYHGGAYQVGYGKPPTHNRFRKGQSGNPTGQRRRPDEAERLKKIISQEAYRMLTVRNGEDIKKIAAVQAVLRSQITSAVKGNVPAQRAIISTIQQVEAEPQARRSGGAASKKHKDVNEMTDEELMAIVTATQNGKS
jgi:Family of unknown function (DUF5681)